MDTKGVSKLYKSLNSGKDSILTNIMNKREKTGQIFPHDEIEKAFTINHQSIYSHMMKVKRLLLSIINPM